VSLPGWRRIWCLTWKGEREGVQDVAPAQRGEVGADGAEGRGAGYGTQTPEVLRAWACGYRLRRCRRAHANRRENARTRVGVLARVAGED